VLVADLLGHAPLDTTRRCSLPSAADRQRAVESALPVDEWAPLQTELSVRYRQPLHIGGVSDEGDVDDVGGGGVLYPGHCTTLANR